MSKAFKKLTGLLLAMLMVVTMIPVMGGRAAAEEAPAFSLYVNGQPTGKSVTRTWLEQNSMDAQIFPFAGGQGKTWQYHVAKGPSYEDVLAYLTGAESLADLPNVAINWNDNGAEQGKFDLYVPDLQNAKKCFKLIAQNGGDIVGSFAVPEEGDDPIESAEAVALDGAADVTPIIAVKEKGFTTYSEAVAASGSWEDSAKNDIMPYVGGNLDKETFLKQGGKIKMGVVNFTGKFAMKNLPELNLKIAVPAASTSTLSFTNTTPRKADFSYALTSIEKQLILKTATWASSNTAIATVDKNGTVTPKGIGSCTVTATAKYKEKDQDTGDWVDKTAVIGRCTVKVDQSAFAPAKPVGLKVKNIKKRTAKLTWKKAANATGYIVYRSKKKNKGYKKIKTLTKLSYKNKKLKRGKTYYYKIKAYRKYQGHTIYSPLTAAKKVKIKK